MGAGLMGAGIAQVSVDKGMKTILKVGVKVYSAIEYFLGGDSCLSRQCNNNVELYAIMAVNYNYICQKSVDLCRT